MTEDEKRGPGRPSLGDDTKQVFALRLKRADRELVELGAAIAGEPPRVFARNAILEKARALCDAAEKKGRRRKRDK